MKIRSIGWRRVERIVRSARWRDQDQHSRRQTGSNETRRSHDERH
jgi:hypothetical protein